MPLGLQLPRCAIPSSWDQAVSAAATNTNLREAVAYFRNVLGEDWPWEAGRHLARSFYSRIQSEQLEWMRLYRLVRQLDGIANVELLVGDLGAAEWRRHIAGQQALEFCARFRAAGHRVEILQPTHDV